ncbi:MAG TPA: hypothetical protein RMH80_11695, partial [Polyangiaceae bacterium LLY-WYZ-15_(1-7)]|nr:hypothetical protein [Polyangiaceae bacterium LLY-WYZ-15_(1-7)]
MLDDGETEPRAPDVARAAHVDPVEALEDALEVVRRDRGAGVVHLEEHVLVLRAHPHVHAGPLGRVLDGVVDEVDEHLVEGPLVRLHPQRLRRRLEDQLHAASLRLGGQPTHHLDHDGLDVDLLELEPVLGRLGLRQRRQVRDQRLEAQRVLEDHVEEAPRRLRIVDDAVLQGLGEAPDRRQRRPQLVARVGDEVAADAVGRAELGHVVEHRHDARALLERRHVTAEGAELFVELDLEGDGPRLAAAGGAHGLVELRAAQRLHRRPPDRRPLDEPVEGVVRLLDAAERVGDEDGLDHRVEHGAQPILLGAEPVDALGELVGHAVERPPDGSELVVARAPGAGREVAGGEGVGDGRELPGRGDEGPREHGGEEEGDHGGHHAGQEEQLADARADALGDRRRLGGLDDERALLREDHVLAELAPRHGLPGPEGREGLGVDRRRGALGVVEARVADDLVALEEREPRPGERADLVGHGVRLDAGAEPVAGASHGVAQGLVRELSEAVLDERILQEEEREDQRADRGDDRADDVASEPAGGSHGWGSLPPRGAGAGTRSAVTAAWRAEAIGGRGRSVGG